jgi:hypothetical protein
VPKHGEDLIGVIVIRASSGGPRGGLVVQVLEVNPGGPDRVLGIVGSVVAACRLVRAWLVALEAGDPDRGRPLESADGDR